jgi:endonuclease/exonuclease/phosphatase (EEP) superfamily protein YafD
METGMATRIAQISVGLFIAFSLCLAASYFGGFWWGLEMLSHLRVQFAAGTTLFVAIFLVQRAYVAAAAATLLLVANAAPLIPYFVPGLGSGHEDRAHPDAAAIRVITLNLQGQRADLDAVRRLIRREAPDIVLITEFETDPALLLRDLDDIFPHRAGSGHAGVFRLLLLSRFAVAEARLHRPSIEFLPVLEVRLCPAAADCFAVIGLHAPGPGSFGTEWRDAALRFAARRAAAVADGRVIVMGDFNATPWSRIFAQVLRIGGLADTAVGSSFRATWTARLPVFGLPIDHVLVGRGIGVGERRVADSIRSDHFPVVADLTLPPTRPAR